MWSQPKRGQYMKKSKLNRELAIILASVMTFSQASVAFAADAPDERLGGEDEALLEAEDIEVISEAEGDSFLENEIGTNIKEQEETDPEAPLEDALKISEDDKEWKNEILDRDALSAFRDMKEGVDYEEGVVVCLATSREEAEKIAEFYEGKLTDFSFGIAKISLFDGSFSVASAFEYALSNDDAPLVEPNYIVPIEETEPEIKRGSEFYSEQSTDVPTQQTWYDQYYVNGFNDPALLISSSNYQYQHEMLGTYAAWAVTTGSSDITVAVIDSGLDVDHVEFAGNIVDVSDEIDILGNGNKAVVGHGTHVAGIIGAGIGNNAGGAGIAPGVGIMPICVSNNNGGADTSSMIKAVLYVAGYDEDGNFTGRKADIINMSIGSKAYNASLQEAINKAYESGVTFVCSIGNDGVSVANYPAAMDHVIAVAAVDRTGTLWSGSTYGQWADIAAPGASIYSTYWMSGQSNYYTSLSGTSMASPMVAGACALYMSAVGHVDPDTMESVLKRSAVKAEDGMGAGIVNLINMFEGDRTAPSISLVDEAGKEIDTSFEVSPNALLSLKQVNYDGLTASNANTAIVYTTDGKNPAIADGKVLHGIKYDGKPVKLSDLGVSFDSKKSLTIKAFAVTGMGVASCISTLTAVVNPEDFANTDIQSEETAEVTIIGAPEKMVAGKTISLGAVVTPLEKPQNVVWSIVSYRNGDLSKASISAAGKLTTNASQSGILRIRCTTSDGTAYSEVEIAIEKDVYPVKTLEIEKTKNLSFNSSTGAGTTEYIHITKLMDTKNSDLLANGGYANVSFEFTSSNEKVVVVERASFDGEATLGRVTAVGGGSAKIYARALDGSGKTAVCIVTVSSTKIVNAVTINTSSNADSYNIAKNKDGSVKSLVLYVEDIGNLHQTIDLYAVQKDSSGSAITAVSTPNWISAKPGVASIVVDNEDGGKVRVKGLSKGKTTVTCMARDGSGKKASITVEVRQNVADLEISGQDYVAAGGATKYKATASPSTANNKKVIWDVYDVDEEPISGVTINSSGKLSVSKSVPNGTVITVCAFAQDGSRSFATKEVTVRAKATKVNLTSSSTTDTLYISAKGTANNQMTLSAVTDNKSKVQWISSNEKILLVKNVTYNEETGENTASIIARAKGTATITAKANDGSGKLAKKTIKVQQLVEDVYIEGQSYMARGSSASYKTQIYPKDANNKKVTWKLFEGTVSGISVDANSGRVKVESYASIGEYTLVATAADPSKKTCAYKFYVTGEKAKKVAILPDEEDSNIDNPIYKLTYSGGALKSLQLSNFDIFSSYTSDDETNIKLKAVITGNETSKGYWTTSNSDVAVVTRDGYVFANGNGTATITCTANDGSNKKASVKVTVITPVSAIAASVKNRQERYICFGKSATLLATIGTAYGKPTTPALSWDYEILGFDDSITDQLKSKKAFFTMSNGKVTVNSKATWESLETKYASFRENEDIGIRVTASTTDGTELSASYVFYATDPQEQLVFRSASSDKVISELKTLECSPDRTRTYKCVINTDPSRFYDVESSNYEIATAYIKADSGKQYLYISTRNPGVTYITVKARDGSDNKAVLKATVSLDE